MSFDATEIIPVEYQSLFQIISPIEKSGILKKIRESYLDYKDRYEALFLGLNDYLINNKNEDISSLVFIMYGQIAMDLTMNNKVSEMLGIYPDSPDLKLYNVQLNIDSGVFDGIDDAVKNARLSEEQRNMVFNRLVAADKLAQVIRDLQSFFVEIIFYARKEEYKKVDELFTLAEDIWIRAIEWSKAKEIIFVLELVARLILQKTQITMTYKGLTPAIEYYEKDGNQVILQDARSNIMKANILRIAAMLYYSAGQPTKGLKHLEKAIKFLPKIHGRNSWKATFYHNLAYMYTLIDTEKSVEAYETCIELLEGSGDLHTLAAALSNLIGIHSQAKRKADARKALKQLVEILEKSSDLVTPFRAYAVAANALSLDDYDLANTYLKKLDHEVEEAPTLLNKAISAGAWFNYYFEAEINSEKAYKFGEETLYYFNKQKDYLNALASIYNLVNLDFQFYKITDKERYLNAAKKRLNELLTLIGALNLPEWIANKNITLAGFEILSNNFDQARSYIEGIPESTDSNIQAHMKIISQLLDFSMTKEEIATDIEGKTNSMIKQQKYSSEPLLNEIATNKDATSTMVMYLIEKTLENLVKLPQEVNPVKADIKLILLINNAGLTIYTKIFDVQKMNQQLISNFISAIDSFGKQLFGTKEPYFSITRGNNIILYQSVTEDINLALIVSQENYDSIMKLNNLAKEISVYLFEHNIDVNKVLKENSDFYKWLELHISELNK